MLDRFSFQLYSARNFPPSQETLAMLAKSATRRSRATAAL